MSSLPGSARPAPPGVILVVDDTPENRYVAARWLERAGFRVATAATGTEALALATRDDIELVLLDVNLPDLHGFEVAKTLKRDPATSHIPVLHLSAQRVSPAERVTGLDAGADGYLTQPVEPDELVATVRALLRLSSTERTLREALVERELLLEARTAERQRLRTLILSIPTPVALLTGPEHRYELHNGAMRQITGLDRDLTGLTLREAHPGLLDAALHERFDQAYTSGEPWFGAETLVRVDRGSGPEELWFDLRLEPLRDPQGTVYALLTLGVDVTARVRARQEMDRAAALTEAERRRLVTVFEQSPSFFAVLRGPDNVFELVNAAYRQIVGKGRELIGKPLYEALPETRGQGFDLFMQQVRETGVPLVFRSLPVQLQRLPDKPLEQRYIDVTYLPLVESDGGRDAVIAHGADVTEQVSAQRELEASNALLVEQQLELELTNQQLLENAADLEMQTERLEETTARLKERTVEAEAARERSEAVLASIADAFYLLDREWRFIYVNDAAEPLLQSRRADLLGRTLWEAFPGVVGSPFEGPYREAMTAGRVTSAEAYFAPLGTWFDVRTYPWSGGLMVHFRDIGERKAAEAERERLLVDAQLARNEAETSNRTKSEFLAVMSHELRTPLNAIDGYAELMELGIRGPLTPEQRSDLARIRKSQRHLLGLINDVLNYSRIEAAAVQYDIESVPLEEALATCEALTAPQRRAKGLAFAIESCGADLRVRADREKLQQILLNLLSNAIKFTEAGGRITVACETAAGVVRVRVRDTGHGIPTEQLARVFEPFVQVNSTLTRTQEGIGLGLAISRDLARGMGGELSVESAPGEGSTFTLTLGEG